MSSYEQSPYTQSILAPLFIEAAFDARETAGDATIPQVRVREFAASLGLETAQAAEHAYWAKKYVAETLNEVEAELG